MLKNAEEGRAPMNDASIHPATRVGHVALWTSDLDRAIAFYRDVLGMQVTQDMREEPTPRPLVFLSASGSYHHHVGLVEQRGKTASPERHTGLFHFALLYPDRRELARALKRLLDHDWPIESMRDYGISEVVNIHDPDGNGVELCYDRPAEQWPRVDDQLRMFNKKLEADLLEELHEEKPGTA
jgi:catechol 2,3-dioxygenase